MILVGRSDIKFQWKYLKRTGCEWDLLHGMSSNYPKTAGKRKLFRHNCEGECCRIFLAPEDMLVGQGFLKHAIPWFVGVSVWYWTYCNSTHGPSRVLGKSLECPCDLTLVTSLVTRVKLHGPMFLVKRPSGLTPMHHCDELACHLETIWQWYRGPGQTDWSVFIA